jgi:hypothetical protein
MIEAIGQALDGRCLTRKELAAEVARLAGDGLRPRLESGWGEFLKPAGFAGLLCFGPPRGQEVTFVRPDQWVKGWTPWETEAARVEILRRYLGAMGPADREEFTWWMGSARANIRPAWAELEPELTEVDMDGRPQWLLRRDLPSARRASGKLPPRLLPGFDPLVLGRKDRRHLVDLDHHERVYRQAGWVSPVVLVDGRVAGVWSQRQAGGRLHVTVDAFGDLKDEVLAELRAEAAALGAFLGLEAEFTLG